MDNIKLTILGSGTMMPTKQRNPAGFLVEVGDKKILLDCGHGTIRRMVDFGFNPEDVDYIFISHFHTDHFSDCFPLVHARWVDDSKLGKSKHSSLTIIGPKELEKRFVSWRKIYWLEKGENYPINFLEGERKLKIGSIEIETFVVKHVKWFQSVGIVIKYKDKKLVYTGDIGSGNDINELANNVKDADLLITEASYQNPTPNHYTIGQVEELVKLANVKKVLVVHINPKHILAVKNACQKNKNWLMGIDGKKIEV